MSIERLRGNDRTGRLDQVSRKEMIIFINELSQELKTLAQDAEADGLTYLLGMVIYEARKEEMAIDRATNRDRSSAIDVQKLYMSDALEK